MAGCVTDDRVPLVHVTGQIEVRGVGPPGEQLAACGYAPSFRVDYTDRTIRHTEGLGPIGSPGTSALVHVDVDVPRLCSEGIALYDIGANGTGVASFSVLGYRFTESLRVDGHRIEAGGRSIEASEFVVFPVDETIGNRTFEGRVVIDHAGLWSLGDIEVVPVREL